MNEAETSGRVCYSKLMKNCTVTNLGKGLKSALDRKSIDRYEQRTPQQMSKRVFTIKNRCGESCDCREKVHVRRSHRLAPQVIIYQLQDARNSLANSTCGRRKGQINQVGPEKDDQALSLGPSIGVEFGKILNDSDSRQDIIEVELHKLFDLFEAQQDHSRCQLDWRLGVVSQPACRLVSIVLIGLVTVRTPVPPSQSEK